MPAPFYKITLGNGSTAVDLSDWVDKVEIADSKERDNMISVTVYDDIDYKVVDSKGLFKGADLTVQFGFMGTASVVGVHKGKVVEINTRYTKGACTTIRAYDKGNYIKTNNRNTVWKNKTSSQIAETIATNNGLSIIVDQTTKVWDSIPQGNRSDIEFLRYLAGRETDGDFHTYLRDDVLYFTKERLDEEAVNLYKIGADERVLSFDVKDEHAANRAQGGGTQLIMVDRNKAIGKIGVNNDNMRNNISLGSYVEQFINDGSFHFTTKTEKPASATTWYGKALDKGMSVVTKLGEDIVHKIIPTPDVGKDVATNIGNRQTKHSKLKQISATLTIVGDPRLKPNQIITISNVAKRHAGNWIVTECRHRIDSGGFLTVLELNRNATGVGTDKAGTVNKSVGDASKSGRKDIDRVYWSNDGNIRVYDKTPITANDFLLGQLKKLHDGTAFVEDGKKPTKQVKTYNGNRGIRRIGGAGGDF